MSDDGKEEIPQEELITMQLQSRELAGNEGGIRERSARARDILQGFKDRWYAAQEAEQ